MTDPSGAGRRGSNSGAKDRPPLREIPPAPLRDGERLLGALVGESTDTDSWAVGYLIAQPDGRVLVYVTPPVGKPDPFGECELAGPDSPEAVGSVLDRMARETAGADPPLAHLYRRLGQAIRGATSRTELDARLAQVTPENVHPEAGTAYFAAIQAINAADSPEELDRVEAALWPVWADTADWDSLREELAGRHRKLLPPHAEIPGSNNELEAILARVTPENTHPEQMPVGGLPVSPSELLALLAFADMHTFQEFDEWPGIVRLMARLYKVVEAADPELMRRWRDSPMTVARECARRGPRDRRQPPMGPAPPREPGHGAGQWDVAPDAFSEEPPIGLPPGASAVRALLDERGDLDPVVRSTVVELRRIIEGEGVASADGRYRVARVGGELYVLGPPDGEPRPVADVLGGAAWLRHVADLVAGRIPESGPLGPPDDAQRLRNEIDHARRELEVYGEPCVMQEGWQEHLDFLLRLAARLGVQPPAEDRTEREARRHEAALGDVGQAAASPYVEPREAMDQMVAEQQLARPAQPRPGSAPGGLVEFLDASPLAEPGAPDLATARDQRGPTGMTEAPGGAATGLYVRGWFGCAAIALLLAAAFALGVWVGRG